MTKKPSLANAQRPRASQRLRSMDELIKAVQSKAPKTGEALQTLPIDQLQPGRYQPRGVRLDDAMDTELTELADSIRTLGIIEPIAVRPAPAGEGTYEILAGDRRWRAAHVAGLTDVPVVAVVGSGDWANLA
jgi:ParB family chromosome partitioning protein